MGTIQAFALALKEKDVYDLTLQRQCQEHSIEI